MTDDEKFVKLGNTFVISNGTLNLRIAQVPPSFVNSFYYDSDYDDEDSFEDSDDEEEATVVRSTKTVGTTVTKTKPPKPIGPDEFYSRDGDSDRFHQGVFECRNCVLKSDPSVFGDAALDRVRKAIGTGSSITQSTIVSEGGGGSAIKGDCSDIHIKDEVQWLINDKGEISNERALASLWIKGINTIRMNHGLPPLSEMIIDDDSSISSIQDGLTVMFITNPQMNQREKNKLIQVIFEQITQVKKVFLLNKSVSSLFGTGRTDGYVAQFGYRSTSLVPCDNGQPMFNVEIHKEQGDYSAVIGRNVLRHLGISIFNECNDASFNHLNWECQIPFLDHMLKTDVNVDSNAMIYQSRLRNAKRDAVKNINDISKIADLLYGYSLCDFNARLPSDMTGLITQIYGFDITHKLITLPDSKTISVSLGPSSLSGMFENHGLLLPKSILMSEDRESLSLKHRSLEQVCRDYVRMDTVKVERSEVEAMVQKLVISGGLSSVNGIRDRMLELVRRHAQHARYHPKIIGNCLRGGEYLPMVGASVMCSISTFEEMTLSRTRWNKFGDQIVPDHCT